MGLTENNLIFEMYKGYASYDPADDWPDYDLPEDDEVLELIAIKALGAKHSIRYVR